MVMSSFKTEVFSWMVWENGQNARKFVRKGQIPILTLTFDSNDLSHTVHLGSEILVYIYTNMHAYAGRRWNSRSGCSNKQYILCLDKIMGTSFHAHKACYSANNALPCPLNNVCLKICMAFSSWVHWRTERNIENKK